MYRVIVWIALAVALCLAAACSRDEQCWAYEPGQGGSGPLPPGQGGSGAFGDAPPGDESGSTLADCAPPDGTTCECHGYIVCRWIAAADPSDKPGPDAGTPWYPCKAPEEEFETGCASLVRTLKDLCLEDAIHAEHERGRSFYENPSGYECRGIPPPDKLYFHCTERLVQTKPWK